MSLKILLETANNYLRTVNPFPFMVVSNEYSKQYDDADTATWAAK